MKTKILVSDPLGEKGLAILKKEKSIQVDVNTGLSEAELVKIIGDYDAVVVRSGTKLTAKVLEQAKKLRLIGRAGVGVDNVDVSAATRQGIVVMNTPEGNTISTCEHTLSMLMALARNIPQANDSVKKGEWDRKRFMGTELNQKTLGVIGLGRIGRQICERALVFGMHVLGYDPFVSKETLRQGGIELVTLEELLKNSDFITVHVPLTEQTKRLINDEAFSKMKKGVYILNCARGGIIDETALLRAIESGKVRGAALDVFESEPPKSNPLLKSERVIVTPHLGAATLEAQENVAVAVAQQIIDALMERGIKNAINVPSLDANTYKVLKPWVKLAERMGLFYAQYFTGSFRKVTIRYGGEVTQYKTDPLTVAVLKGLLSPICGEGVNFVNAPSLAKERSIAVEEIRSTAVEDFTNYIELEVSVNGKQNVVMGTLFGNEDPRIVRINEFRLDARPRGVVLVIHNEDLPGVVGQVGTALGKNKINIADMTLSRISKGKKAFALTVINTDNDIPAKVLKELSNIKPIIDTKVVKL
ncbi:MAG: phosphoglycerate dehydrogenase [Candidatus Omnitrophica bacterium CG11_big_fil_rev_8_21_14_0_20_45_26]|uniref:D-3-phosphoglycerate dehydrogenase n=1 Tax=Candidatus Abzuiibacterium crystallinum TaxID=1974748 RepID=A0A2H0LT32_9BACT|nr:MAG: phosphoglycerate dehydrogenase [Candidatus Omnitrophica bacterium CG11_big_fil_rev_8_21_14_0_20_45_26]PIW65459.1 MAG: phosphoglycerate dehydrogenase [Candidatus Omnitrophica bacterium CG12_big_fil_rev_8_21_14_0_65_45_16]